MFLSQLSLLLLLLYCLLFTTVVTGEGDCNGQYTEITVSKNGSDSNCTTSYKCATLQYVLTNVTLKNCTRISVHDNQTIDRLVTIKGINGLVIQGAEAVLPTVYTVRQAGIELVNCNNIHLMTIEWVDYERKITPILSIINCANVSIADCMFHVSSGLILANNRGKVDISNCHFNQLQANSIPLLNMTMNDNDVSNSSYTVTNCVLNGAYPHDTLSNVISLDSKVPNATIKGGGLFVEVKVSYIDIVISGTNFTYNVAQETGGGLYLLVHSTTVGNTINIKGCTFVGNRAFELGGGLYLGILADPNETEPHKIDISVDIDLCNFLDNAAQHAGALALESVGQQSLNVPEIIFRNVTFEHNIAIYSGAAVSLFKWLHVPSQGVVTPTISFVNCSVIFNSIAIPDTSETTVVGSGVIYTDHVPIAFKGYTYISHNTGTAILSSSASIHMSNTVKMSYNKGVRGGVFNLLGAARIVVESGLSMSFENNFADLFGGVVYHVFPVLAVAGANEHCTFQYEYDTITDPSEWNATIQFVNNTALQGGHSVYLSNSYDCHSNENGMIFTENDTFIFTPNNIYQVMTPAVSITFDSNSSFFHCSSIATGELCTIEAMLGEEITLAAQAIDAFGHLIKSFAIVELYCETNGKLFWNESCDYGLGGINLIELNNETLRVPFHIKGPEAQSSVVLVWQTLEEPSTVAFLQVNIVDCYLGYVYNTDTQTCSCFSKSTEVLYCNETDYTACIKTGYWYGPVDDYDNNTQYSTAACHFGFCNYAINGQCPTMSCGPDGSSYQFFCVLPKYDSNSLCLFNRGGPICSSCKSNYSFTFDAIGCVPDESCSAGVVVLIIFLYILFWALLISLILLVTKLNLRFGSGQLYCLIFFFSVLQYFIRGSFPSYFLYIFDLVVTGFIQLDPKILGVIKLCSPGVFNNLQYTAVHYVNSFFLITAIGLLIFASRKWPKYVPFANNNGAVNMICIVLYLVFFSLTQTSLAVLTPVRYPKISQAFVSLEPSVRYFDPSGHMPYALIALLVQLVLVLPFLSLLLFAPCLIKIRRLNLTRLKPILDEYQACYKEQYRSFAGYYLTCRQLIFLISLLPINMTSYIYILQILSILILTVHCLVQPYTSLQLNIVDGLLILDLVLLSILHGSTANVVFDDVFILKAIIVHILVLLPVLYFGILCIFSLVKLFPELVKILKKVKVFFIRDKVTIRERSLSTRPTIIPTTNVIDITGNKESVVVVNPLEREPLLFLLTETTEYNTVNTTT